MDERYDFCTKCNHKRDLISTKMDEPKGLYIHTYVCPVCNSTVKHTEGNEA